MLRVLLLLFLYTPRSVCMHCVAVKVMFLHLVISVYILEYNGDIPFCMRRASYSPTVTLLHTSLVQNLVIPKYLILK